jgi:acyl carrier protein
MSTELNADQAEHIRSETYAVIQAMAREHPGEMSGDLSLVEHLGFDSLRLIELAIAVEQHFGLPPVDLENAVTVATVEDVVQLVASLYPGRVSR